MQIPEIDTNEQFDRPALNALHSNKANMKFDFQQSNPKRNERREDIITEGISKDGQYQVMSRAIYDEELKKAVEL